MSRPEAGKAEKAGSGTASPASASPAGTPNSSRSRRLGIGALSLADTIRKKGEDELDHSNYAIMRQLGSGAFSAVWMADHRETHDKFAIKKIIDVFRSAGDARHTLREIRLLKHFRHPHIITMKQILVPEDRDEFLHVYIVFELMDSDLFHHLQKLSLDEKLGTAELQKYTYQLLRGLEAIHRAGVLHRDLKPGNLLVSRTGDLKICDFGSGRGDTDGTVKLDTRKFTQLSDVTTICYRAPEGLLNAPKYTTAVDMWSVGCIIGEMIGKTPLFGARNLNVIVDSMFESLGTPSEEELVKIASPEFATYVRAQKQLPKKTISEAFPQLSENGVVDPLALDLISKLLQYDPDKRLTAAEALQHPFVKPVTDTHSSAIYPNIPVFVNPDENHDSVSAYRSLIYQEIMKVPVETPRESVKATPAAAAGIFSAP